MNSAVIVKVEYRFAKDTDLSFSDLNIIPYSGRLSENVSPKKAGKLHQVKLRFNIDNVNPDKDALLNFISDIPIHIKAYDANGRIHYIGDDEFQARLSFDKALDGKAGSFNGYRCSIDYDTPYGAVVV